MVKETNYKDYLKKNYFKKGLFLIDFFIITGLIQYFIFNGSFENMLKWIKNSIEYFFNFLFFS